MAQYYKLDGDGVGTAANPWLTEDGGSSSRRMADVTKLAMQIACEMAELNQYLRTLALDAPELADTLGRLQALHERLKYLQLVQFAEGRSAPIQGRYNAPISGGYQ